MSYLDSRGQLILRQIADHPSITGKEIEKKYSLTRKQVSYTISKINDYLIDNGYEKITRLKTGTFSASTFVVGEFKTEGASFEEVEYICSDKERQNLIVLILLCRQEELSTFHFISSLGVSKNTFLSDMKKLQAKINETYRLNVLYSRKEGYTLIGNEYAKRELLIGAIRKILSMPNGTDSIRKLGNVESIDIEEMKFDIAEIEKKLEIQFTDERLRELPYILRLIIQRIHTNKLLDTIPEAFQHIVGTKEYTATAFFANKHKIENQLEKMFLSAQIQISNIHHLKTDEYKTEKELLEATDAMIRNFESICCIQIKERKQLLEALLQHCKPAFYRIKYNFHIENSIIDLVLPQHSYLHEVVKKAAEPLAQLVEHEISDDELVYITVLFGAWLRREGLLDAVEEKRKAVVVCANGVSVSNFLFITLKELFPEFKFITCLSVRGFHEYKNDYNLVFSTVRLETNKLQFMVKPFLNEYSKQSFREKVFREIEGVNLHTIQISSLINIVEKHATIHDKEQLISELNQYVNFDHTIKKNNEEQEQYALAQGVQLHQLLTKETIQILDHEVGWEEAIRYASKPLVEKGSIEPCYVDTMIQSIHESKPYIMIADGVIIAHAGVDDGVNEVAMSLLKLPSKINVSDYMNADIMIVLGTPDLANSVIEASKESDVFLLEKHGAVAIDTDIYEAFLKASYVEELAELYHHSLCATGGVEPDAFVQSELKSWEYPKEIKFNQ